MARWQDAPVVGRGDQQKTPAWQAAPVVEQPAAQPTPPTAEQAGQRSAARRPGGQLEPAFLQSLPPEDRAAARGAVDRTGPSARQQLEAQGVGMQEAPFGAQFEFGLGAPLAETPEQKMELARAVLRLPPDRVSFDPQTEQVLFKPEGSEQFQVFNAPGISWGDLTRFLPEAGVVGAGVVGGLVGGGAGTATANPLGVATGTVLGGGVGEGVAEATRIMLAAQRGLVDPTPNEIMQAALGRGSEAVIGGAVAGGAASLVRRAIAARLGMDADVIGALGDRPLSEISQQSKATQRQVRQATGEDFPLTLGQQTGSQEVLKAEEAGRRLREINAPLRDIQERQQPALRALEQRALGDPVDPQVRREVGEEALRQGEARVSAAEAGLETATHRAFGRGVPPEQGVSRVREKIEQGQEQIFAPLKRQFDELQQESGVNIDLSSVRQEAKRLGSEEGQRILKSVSLHAQSPLLREGRSAGLERVEVEPGVFEMVERPVSLGEVQRALRDIRAELRRPGIKDEPTRKRILTRMEDALVQARDKSLPSTDLARVHMLEGDFAQAMNTLKRDIVGEFMDVDPITRVPKMTGTQTVQRLLRNPEDTDRFIEALDSLPTGAAAKVRVRDSVMGYLRETYQNPDTGEIDPARLRGFLRNRNNREALSHIFSGRPQVLKNLDDAQKASEKLNELHKQMETARGRMDKALGIPTADPAELVTKFMNEADPRGLKVARRLLPPDRRPQFDQVLRASFRDRMVNKEGMVDPGKIDEFLGSNRANVAREMFGERYLDDLRLLKDATRLATQRPERGTAGDLAQYFSRDINALQGLMRFTRVPFAPLSVQGRAFTASLGLFQDRARRRMADLIANPEDLRELARLAKVSPGSRRAEIILGRLGLDSYAVARDEFFEQQERNRTTAEDVPTPRAAP